MHMPYPDDQFDTVLLISILEHLKPEVQVATMNEIKRVLKPGGQLVYGVPVERPFMVFMFRLMGVNIRELHFSTEADISRAAETVFRRVQVFDLKNPLGMGALYQIGHFVKET
jgi:ubiquinone/menaquinone biosynthesis C-methylase UbiE